MSVKVNRNIFKSPCVSNGIYCYLTQIRILVLVFQLHLNPELACSIRVLSPIFLYIKL